MQEKSREKHHRVAHGIVHFLQDDAAVEDIETVQFVDLAVKVKSPLQITSKVISQIEDLPDI